MFESAKLKIGRAEHHIADLKGQLEAFALRNPHRFSVKSDSNTGQPVIQIRFVEPIPESFSVVIGDATHNLRSALDHMTWELIGWDGGKQSKYLVFGCRDDAAQFEAWCNGIETPSAWIKDFFREFEAYDGGDGEALATLHQLDVADKHRAIRFAIAATMIPDFTIYRENGSALMTMSRTSVVGNRESFRVTNVPKGGWVELHKDAQCTPGIFLPDVGGMDAFQALERFRAAIVGALERFEWAVAEHPKR